MYIAGISIEAGALDRALAVLGIVIVSTYASLG